MYLYVRKVKGRGRTGCDKMTSKYMKMCRIRGLTQSPFAHFPGHFLCVKMIIVLLVVVLVRLRLST